MAEARQTGRVVDWKDKGFGFIRPGDGGKDVFLHGKDVFFHASDIDRGPVFTGALVSFTVRETDKGYRAMTVRAQEVPSDSGELEADLLSPDQLWAEIAPQLKQLVISVARSHNWVED